MLTPPFTFCYLSWPWVMRLKEMDLTFTSCSTQESKTCIHLGSALELTLSECK